MPAHRIASATIHTLRVELRGIEPLIWRLLHVSTSISLPRLHNALQAVIGWTNSHLHSFRIDDREYSNAEDPGDLNMLAERGRNLGALLGDAIREFEYRYDFGDGWEHRIIVESISSPVPDWPYPLCVAGERACPPEDVGGVRGYENFLKVVADQKDDEHDSTLVWVGGAFDPEGFDINCVNRELRRRRL